MARMQVNPPDQSELHRLPAAHVRLALRRMPQCERLTQYFTLRTRRGADDGGDQRVFRCTKFSGAQHGRGKVRGMMQSTNSAWCVTASVTCVRS
jgi:hypothetical protein